MINDTWIEYNGHLYQYFTDGTVSARDASEYCAADGALLVSINTAEEMTYIEDEVLRKRTLSAFIGGSDEDEGMTSRNIETCIA